MASAPVCQAYYAVKIFSGRCVR